MSGGPVAPEPEHPQPERAESAYADSAHTEPAYPIDGPSRRTTIALVTAFVMVILASVSAFVSVPYVVLSPGPIANVLGSGSTGKPVITVSGAKAYPAKGSLNFTTVRELGGPDNSASALEVAFAAIDPSQDVFPSELFYPEGVTGQQVEEENTAEMVDSQQVATAVALRALGQEVTDHVVVGAISDGAPAKGKLQPGDQIEDVDGIAATTNTAVRDAVRKHKPGETATVKVVRNGTSLSVPIVTTNANGNAALGIVLGTTYDFPYTVTIDVGQVGGPSAGTMLALGIYDLLTPGDLTGGQQIAGTGTLSEDGQVGPIGGIAQKLKGAVDGGAKYFLAPVSNCNEVVGRVPDGLQVVKIGTYAEALAAVKSIAAGTAASLPTCTQADADAANAAQSGN